MSTRASSARAAKPAAAAAHADDDDGEEPDAGGAVGTTPLDGLNVAPFLYKLRALVDEASTNDIVSWSASGLSFVVHSIPRFEQEARALSPCPALLPAPSAHVPRSHRHPLAPCGAGAAPQLQAQQLRVLRAPGARAQLAARAPPTARDPCAYARALFLTSK